MPRIRNKVVAAAYRIRWIKENPEKQAAKQRRHYLKHRDRILAQQAERYKNSAEVRLKSKHQHLIQTYGLSAEEYFAMVEKQNGLCAICHQPQPVWGAKKHLTVDHDHETDARRDLLCSKCNLALGFVGDDIDILKSMISYLERWAK